MLDHFWTVLGLGSGPISVAGLWMMLGRRRTATPATGPAGPGLAYERRRGDLAPTIESAELQLAMLFRRMRAYLRDPYDYARSRISSEAEFEDCLDLATELSIRIGDLCGAATMEAAERERIRGQVLQGVMLGNGMGVRQGAQPMLPQVRMHPGRKC